MTLDEAIAYYDHMADECRRKADIEQDDYMDLKDEAAECEQLSGWLNELKVLREKIQLLLGKIQGQNRWHVVAKEGNPKERGFYLWTSKDGTVREDLYRICDNTWTWCIAWRDGYDVVAWRPLPEPYKEEDDATD